MKFGKEIDSTTLIGVREGDEAAFQMVYDTYSVRFYNFAYRFIRNKELSEEIVQEKLLNLWRSRDRLDLVLRGRCQCMRVLILVLKLSLADLCYGKGMAIIYQSY